jgi:hypothetical protein
VIGNSSTFCWLTGDSTKAIKPGAGIRDSLGNLGEANQVLSSTGANALQWMTLPTPPTPPTPTPPSFETLTTSKTFVAGQTRSVFRVSNNDVIPFSGWVFLYARNTASNQVSMKQKMDFYQVGGTPTVSPTEVFEMNSFPANLGNWSNSSVSGKHTYTFQANVAGTYVLTIKYMAFQGGPLIIV